MSEVKKNPYRGLIFTLFLALITTIGTIIYYIYDYNLWMAELGTDETYYIFTTYEYLHILFWAILAVTNFFLTFKVFGWNSTQGKVWFFIGIGLLCWVIGDAYYTYMWVVLELEEYPEPNPARILYTIGYFILIIGVGFQLSLSKVELAKKEWVIILIIELVIIVLGVIYCIMPIVNTEVSETFLIQTKIFQFVYSSFDFLMIFLSLVLIFRYKGGQFGKSWIILAVGFFLSGFYDLLYLFYYQIDPEYTYYYYYLDHVYYWLYIILGLGAIHLRSSMKLLESV
jgi:hypothetical protein